MYKFAAVALLAGVAMAQIPGLPSCAQGCVSDYGGCNQVDVKCICSNMPLLEKLSCCVSKNCDAAGTKDVIAFANALCGSYGVTTLPTAATCLATGSTPSATASSASSASSETGTPATTSAPSSATTSAPSSQPSTSGSASARPQTTSGSSSSAAAAAAPTNVAQQVLALGLGAVGLFAAL